MAENQNAADQASTLNDERATRLAKRAALFEAGQNPYPEHSEIEDYVADIEAKYAELADGVAAERRVRLLADVMLHLAGVLLGGLGVDAELHEKLRERMVPVEHFRGDLHAAGRQGDESVAIHRDMAALAQALGRVGHARLRHAELLRDVDRADVTVFLLHHQHCFQIVFRSSQDLHSGFHQPFRKIASRLAHLNQKCKQCKNFYKYPLTRAVR